MTVRVPSDGFEVRTALEASIYDWSDQPHWQCLTTLLYVVRHQPKKHRSSIREQQSLIITEL